MATLEKSKEINLLMTAIERKEKTEQILRSLGITLIDQLPPLEEESAVRLRTPQEIAKRLLILTYLNCIVEADHLKQDVILFLKKEGLWESTTAQEKTWFEKKELTETEVTQILWRGEAIWFMLWALDKTDKLELPVSEINIDKVIPLLPPFMQDTTGFITSATIRSTTEILDQADLTFRLLWALREADLDGSYELPLNAGIVHERYNAINWIMFVNEKWDE
ncbi:DUF4272 domain-containing protein [Chryseosolibacter indicus]|uniref:DUF4272 domain-containing protein n=1 Tax=Chryseosolibacter indicus TaxID=2782351 RepID=A0ABS5VMB3_9BACT|nr:DUF4272 domain-containing protein [Chryseosolibacter indicus]MBT1701975.1 DUF4272 domain-containing protein [Chryseosolibacter indicus]